VDGDTPTRVRLSDWEVPQRLFNRIDRTGGELVSGPGSCRRNFGDCTGPQS
jgi:hypothetical protein